MKLQNAKLKMIEISDKIELGRQSEELYPNFITNTSQQKRDKRKI